MNRENQTRVDAESGISSYYHTTLRQSTLVNPHRISHANALSCEPTVPPPPQEAPWKIGIRAARANFLPGLIVQGAMLALLLAYYHHPATTEALGRLAELKQRTGYLYTAVSAMIGGAIIPEILRILFFQKGRFQAHNISNLLFTIPFWSVMAITVDLFYQLQARLFGTDVDFSTVTIKVLVDQFGYTAFFATPMTCILYDWKQQGYQPRTLLRVFSLEYYRTTAFPVLITNWAVWIPLITILYCLPLSLQIPLFGLALSLWVLLYTWISESSHGQKNP
jgi:hypothetical protein